MKANEIDLDNLTFSFTETRSMYVAKCKQNGEWETGKIVPFGNLSLSPAATVLNYGQGLFEGMKHTDGTMVGLQCSDLKGMQKELQKVAIDYLCLKFQKRFS